ncbi:AN1-type zinc finger protein 3-like isoform X1 [Mizuhopecten yessoensis]|uniref:AN1-type zinc finger protein 3 n=1 Tax=Mizuhopecten yessoensis TaxID=6573 RepID=A0A210R6Z3_MIZYE|nr:AN1-type zinc finger protein 3-like isoform X1 [Mizuhopecten yessoensis]OWF56837.1 AN1-type zinc finger protein 3 [Mizuhopecten yessoensis]
MEESKSSEPSRCPCGFWGSPSTLGLCSTCYKAHQEKTQDALKSTPDHMIRKQDSGRQLMSRSHDLESTNNTPQPSSSKASSVLTTENLSEKLQEHMKHIPVTENVCIDTSSELQTTCLTTNKNYNSANSEESNANQNGKCSDTDSAQASGSDEAKGVKRPLEPDSTPESTPEKGKQKNRKRCFQCNAKLELAQRQIGRCRCELIFCSLHRLPELHNCEFDHKEDGRLQARQKMVKPTRHLGNEFRRLESDS